MDHTRLPRRALFRSAAAVATLGVGAACGVPGRKKSTGASVTLKIAIVPDPTGASDFYRKQFDTFSTQNPRIHVDVVENPTEQEVNAVSLMFQQGKGPDVYRAQGSAALDQFVQHGWAADLTPHASADFFSRFPKGSMDPKISGLHRNGGLYSLPLVAGKAWGGSLLCYNKAILNDAGFSSPPSAWSQLVDMAKQITKRGNGKVYGFAPQTSVAPDVGSFQATAGPSSIGSTGIDYRSGQPAITDRSLLDTVEMYRNLQHQKVMTPGWESWDGTRAYTEFAKERLGMYVAGNWHINEIVTLNPQIQIGIAVTPVPDSGRAGYPGVGSTFQPIWSMSAKSKHPAEAWKLMEFLVSPEFQRAYFEKFRSFTAVESAWRSGVKLSPTEQAMLTVEDTQIKSAPDPSVSRPGGPAQLITDLRGNPDLSWGPAAVAAITRNQDFGSKAASLNSSLGGFLRTDMKKLTARGMKVAAADLAFPSWDPLSNWAPGSR